MLHFKIVKKNTNIKIIPKCMYKHEASIYLNVMTSNHNTVQFHGGTDSLNS